MAPLTKRGKGGNESESGNGEAQDRGRSRRLLFGEGDTAEITCGAGANKPGGAEAIVSRLSREGCGPPELAVVTHRRSRPASHQMLNLFLVSLGQREARGGFQSTADVIRNLARSYRLSLSVPWSSPFRNLKLVKLTRKSEHRTVRQRTNEPELADRFQD